MAKQHDWEFLSRFGKRIAEVRRQRGLTQEALADAANLHRTYIGFIEQGKRDPTIGNVQQIAKALGTPLKELLGVLDKEKTQ